MRILRGIAAIVLLTAAAWAQKNDWLIVPGQRVGPITASTTRAQLDALFGKENVRDGSYAGGEIPEAATVVFGSEPGSALAVTWDRERPAAIHLCVDSQTGPCRWRTASGIRIGLPVRELEKLNGKSFQVGGFGQDRGQVVSWRKGALEEDPTTCGHLVVRLTPLVLAEGGTLSKDETSNLKILQSDKTFSSSYVVSLGLQPIVSGLTMEFTGPNCGK